MPIPAAACCGIHALGCSGGTSCSNELRQQLAAPEGDPLAGTGTMPDGDLQVHPGKLDFTAAAGTDAPVTLTLFNPHPSERLAFKASSLPHSPAVSRHTFSSENVEHQKCNVRPVMGKCAFRCASALALCTHVGVRRVQTDQIRLPNCPLRSVTAPILPRSAYSTRDRWISTRRGFPRSVVLASLWAGRGLGPCMGLGRTWAWAAHGLGQVAMAPVDGCTVGADQDNSQQHVPSVAQQWRAGAWRDSPRAGASVQQAASLPTRPCYSACLVAAARPGMWRLVRGPKRSFVSLLYSWYWPQASQWLSQNES